MTLCDVATSYQPKNNAEPTLKCLLGFYSLSITVAMAIRGKSSLNSNASWQLPCRLSGILLVVSISCRILQFVGMSVGSFVKCWLSSIIYGLLRKSFVRPSNFAFTDLNIAKKLCAQHSVSFKIITSS